MQVIKALVGGIIGGGIGVFLSGQIQSMADLSSPWFLLIIGLGTGIGARLACGANRSFATGVTGAVAAILMIFGSSYMDAVSEATGSAETNAEPVSTFDLSDVAPADPAEVEEEAADTGDAEEAGTAEEPESDGEAEAEAGDDAETDDDAVAISDSSAGTGPSTTSHAPADTTTPIAPARSRFDWSPMDFLINGGSALLAFALSSGSGAAAGGGASRSKDSDA